MQAQFFLLLSQKIHWVKNDTVYVSKNNGGLIIEGNYNDQWTTTLAAEGIRRVGNLTTFIAFILETKPFNRSSSRMPPHNFNGHFYYIFTNR